MAILNNRVAVCAQQDRRSLVQRDCLYDARAARLNRRSGRQPADPHANAARVGAYLAARKAVLLSSRRVRPVRGAFALCGLIPAARHALLHQRRPLLPLHRVYQ